MNIRVSAGFLLLVTFFGTSAGNATDQQDSRAVDVLERMSAYTASMNRFTISAESITDARLAVGLIVSNPTESEIVVDRSGSMRVSSFDGVDTRNIYIHDGILTVFSTEHDYYARTDAPKDLEEALRYALNEFDVETPLMDFIFADGVAHLLADQETVIYLTDKSRIGGVDCDHIVMRGPEVDLQLWVEEGARPVPRKMIMTSKFEAGSPRHTAVLDWTLQSNLDSAIFEFEAPIGSIEIEFLPAL